jgi:hypothetical protein
MAARPTTTEVMQGLATTSAKIRALAQAGYDRTEISKELGIRYQHVRKVLVDAGITSGLRRQVEAVREPVTIDTAPPSRNSTSWEVLLRAGFQFLGEWTLTAEGTLRLDAQAPAEPGVYAFVLGDVVAYVGLTNNGLRTRMDQYRRGHEGQRTSARVKDLIGQALVHGPEPAPDRVGACGSLCRAGWPRDERAQREAAARGHPDAVRLARGRSGDAA